MADLLGEADLLGRARTALSTSGVANGELYVRRQLRGFARYALNALSQHGELNEDRVHARAAVPGPNGFRLASVQTDDVSADGMVAALRRAEEIARLSDPVEGFPGLAEPDPRVIDPVSRFAAATAGCTSVDRATMLSPALGLAREARLSAAGSLESTAYEVVAANTRGVARYASGTSASFRMFALDPDGVSGFAQGAHRDVGRVDVVSLAREACENARAGRDPVILPAGEYDVVLEPPAVAELLEWMAFIAFGGQAVADGTSPLAGREGDTITGAAVTIVDDAHDASDLGTGVGFDREGVTRTRVVLVDAGRAGRPVTDLLRGARVGGPSTGHAAPPDVAEMGPLPQSLQMAGGDATIPSLTARVQRGLHITRLHYVNGFLDRRRALMTGLTRDGTFLIEDGRRIRGVANMRFTDSVLEAFARIDGLTRDRAAVPTWWSDAGWIVAPAVLIRGLRFTGGGVERPRA